MLRGKNVSSIVSYIAVYIFHTVQVSNSIWTESSAQSLPTAMIYDFFPILFATKWLTTSPKEELSYKVFVGVWLGDTMTPVKGHEDGWYLCSKGMSESVHQFQVKKGRTEF